MSIGESAGGLIGWARYGSGSYGARFCYIDDTRIEGRNKVGGIVGEFSSGTIYGCLVNAKVKATDHTAGGIIGYMNNENMTAASNRIYMYNNGVVDTNLEGPAKVGGMVGNIAKDLNTEEKFFYNNYVHAFLECKNTETVSMGVGGSKENNENITNTYIYKYNQINGEFMNENIDTYTEEQYVDGTDLRQESIYSSTFRWGTYFTYTSLADDKYPIPSEVENVEGVDLPTDPEIVDINAIGTDDENNTTTIEPNSNDISTQSIEALPEVTIYPISVNEINIDFSNIIEETSFTYYINGQRIETIDLTEKTYTFEYNFVDTLEIVVSNGVDEETITINPEEVRSEISLVGDSYAYLIGNNLYVNGELQQGEYVNIYSGYVLSSSGKVIDIPNKEITSDEIVETKLQETSQPLYTYEYNGNSIEVYGTYSKIDGNIKSQIYNVRSGELSAISNNLDIKTNNYIVDYYNDKEYQTILTSSGEIVDLKEQLQYPANFLSRNIKQIVQNNDVENTEMMVLYNTGKVIIFNYVNGNVIYETEEKADTGLTNYITGSINSIWSDYENKQSEYTRSKALIAKLAEMPIEEILEESNNNSNSNTIIESINNISISNSNQSNSNTISNEDSYITVYNGETGEYEVYSETEILEGTEEKPVSETEKIKENGLESIYNYEQEEETGNKVNGVIIVAIIIGIAIISLIILRKLIYRSNTKK